MTLNKNTVHGVEIIAFDFSPSGDQWEKFLAYARKAAPPELKSKIKSVHVFATFNEHGTTFHISYTISMDAGSFVPEHEINALEGES